MFVQTNLDITQQKRFYFRGKKEKKKKKQNKTKQNKPVGQQGSFHISFCSPSPSLSAFSIPLFRPLQFNFILFPPLVLFLSSFFLIIFFIIVLKQLQLRNPFLLRAIKWVTMYNGFSLCAFLSTNTRYRFLYFRMNHC